MTREGFVELMGEEDYSSGWEGCNVFSGLEIIRKYIPGAGIEGADHDIVYSVDIDKLVEAGITEEDTMKLRGLNWMVEDNDYLACHV